jgi:two-component system cell cycle sensor histidine kinase/response regulator CckA
LVEGDSGGVEKIILNLAVNARDAMPRGGVLEISTRRVVLDEEYCRVHVSVEPGVYGVLVVKDSGCGMSSEIRERIFEPFYTTKEKGKGTGLGLSTVYGIVRQCQGCIEVESAIGMGSAFRVFFRSVASEAEGGNTMAHMALPHGHETVLVVEDDAAVRSYAGRALSSLGYKVIEAVDMKEAVNIFRELTKPIHLILADVVLPDGNGVEMVAKVSEIRRDFKILYVTGFDETAVAQHGLDFDHHRFITKPYTLEVLAENVRRILDDAV